MVLYIKNFLSVDVADVSDAIIRSLGVQVYRVDLLGGNEGILL